MNIFLILIGIVLMGLTYRFILNPNNIISKKTINEKLDLLSDKIDYLQEKMDIEDITLSGEKTLSSKLNFEDLIITELNQEKNTMDNQNINKNIKNEEKKDIKGIKDINEEIFKDYNEGLTVSQLASKYKKGKGEIELRLNLKK